MRLLGLLLFLFGAATLVLHFVEPGVEQLRWVDSWGEGVAWGIRGGSTGLGLLLLLTGRGKGAKKK
ncbi:MAG: hypothetical protein KF830_04910 [Planctomycetes bacterium]|nr:hypothetical protein [Planctomycetota bacterium]